MDLAEKFIRYFTIDIAEQLGYRELVEFCDNNYGKDNFDMKAAMLIGYEQISARFNAPIYFSEEVRQYIEKTVKPYTDVGVEIPYFLIGHYYPFPNNTFVYIDKVLDFNDKPNLEHNKAVVTLESTKQIEKEVRKGSNAIIMGHSHPKIIEKDSEPDDYSKLYDFMRVQKEKFGLRGDNLDMTLEDIYSLVALCQNIIAINKKAIVMGGIYHNNGELNLVRYDGLFDISLATDVYYKSKDGSLIPVMNYDSNNMRKVR